MTRYTGIIGRGHWSHIQASSPFGHLYINPRIQTWGLPVLSLGRSPVEAEHLAPGMAPGALEGSPASHGVGSYSLFLLGMPLSLPGSGKFLQLPEASWAGLA